MNKTNVDWMTPWNSVAANKDQVSAMQAELQRELSPGHPLFGLSVQTLARRQDCDDVLFSIVDGSNRVAVVHLTWRQAAEMFPWPGTVIYESFEDWLTQGMQIDHDEFTS